MHSLESEMTTFNDSLKTALLKSIALTGSAEASPIKIHLNEALNNVIDMSSGKARIKPTIRNKFTLILSQPKSLEALSNLEIRCLSCKKVISYPAWWLVIKYDVNEFNYFVCFDSRENKHPILACSRGK